MKGFSQYIKEQEELLEKLIVLGGQRYPNFGNIVLLAGGAGSGKGFVRKKLLGLEGRVLDVDDLKTLASKTPAIQRKVKSEFGVDLEDLASNLKDSKNVSKLHQIIGKELNLPSKREQQLFASILAADENRKPNIIFDMTLKELDKLYTYSAEASRLGYDKKNIHIVWVINDVEIAKKQNVERDRVVPVEILVNTHRGAANTMGDIVNMGKNLQRTMDGDIVFAFNKVDVDSDVMKSGRGGSYVKDANYFYAKRQGRQPLKVEQLERSIVQKIKDYVPDEVWKT